MNLERAYLQIRYTDGSAGRHSRHSHIIARGPEAGTLAAFRGRFGFAPREVTLSFADSLRSSAIGAKRKAVPAPRRLDTAFRFPTLFLHLPCPVLCLRHSTQIQPYFSTFDRSKVTKNLIVAASRIVLRACAAADRGLRPLHAASVVACRRTSGLRPPRGERGRGASPHVRGLPTTPRGGAVRRVTA